MFDCATTPWPIVDTKARICVRQSLYSVPAGLSLPRVEVRLGARSFAVIADAKVVARHQRSLHKGTEDLLLDHYLEILVRKPGALPGSTALAQARSSGAFGATHDAFWEAARRRLGDGAGTRALSGVLLLHRSLPAHAVVAGMTAAMRTDSVDPDAVAVEARRSLEPVRAPAAVVPIGARPAGTHAVELRRAARGGTMSGRTEEAAQAAIGIGVPVPAPADRARGGARRPASQAAIPVPMRSRGAELLFQVIPSGRSGPPSPAPPRVVQRLGSDVHRSPPRRRGGRPLDLSGADHRDRHQQLSAAHRPGGQGHPSRRRRRTGQVRR